MVKKAIPQKIIAIDILRASAALGVFYYHNHMGSVLAKYTGFSLLGISDGFGAGYAVPLFFLISGYCIHASNIKYIKQDFSLPLKEYYLRRFLRIYPPYIVALFFSLVVNWLTNERYKPEGVDLIMHFFLLQGFSVNYFNSINLVLWTISIELAFYVIYPLFYWIRFKYDLNSALLVTFLISSISISCFSIKNDLTLPQRFCVFNLWFAWCCGAFLADKKMVGLANFKKPVYILSYSVIVIGFVYLNYVRLTLPILHDQFNILIWTAPTLFILSCEDWFRANQNLWVIKVLAAIGLSSYSLYLLHEPLIYFKNFLVHRYFPASFQLVGVAAGILIIPLIAWWHYSLVEKPFIGKRKIS